MKVILPTRFINKYDLRNAPGNLEYIMCLGQLQQHYIHYTYVTLQIQISNEYQFLYFQWAGASAYCASKSALDQLTKCAAIGELHKLSVICDYYHMI